MEETLEANVASTSKETTLKSGPSSSKLSTSDITYTFCQPSTTTLTSAGLSKSPLPSTSAGHSKSSLPSNSAGHSKSSLPSTSAGHSKLSLPSTSAGHSKSSLPSTSAGHSNSSLPSTSSGHSKSPLPSTSSGHSKSPLPSTSSGHSKSPLPSTSAGFSRLPFPSTSKAFSRLSLPSSSGKPLKSPLPSTSGTNLRPPLPSTSESHSKAPLPSTSKSPSSESPLPSTSAESPPSTSASTPPLSEPQYERISARELIKGAVIQFLKRRNYPIEAYQNDNMKTTQTKNQFMFDRLVEVDLSKSNSFLFSNAICLTNNPDIVDLHFAKFVNFVKSQPPEIQVELSDLFGPLICHLYVELLKGKNYIPAIKFLRKYAPLVGTMADTIPISKEPDIYTSDESDEDYDVLLRVADKSEDIVMIDDESDDEDDDDNQDKNEIIDENKNDYEIIDENTNENEIIDENTNENEIIDENKNESENESKDSNENENIDEIEVENVVENENIDKNENLDANENAGVNEISDENQDNQNEHQIGDENVEEEDDENEDEDSFSEASVTEQIFFDELSPGSLLQEYFKPVIHELSKCRNMKHVSYYEHLVILRSAKITVNISMKSLNELNSFLQRMGHIIILNAINNWIHFNITEISDEIEECTSNVCDETNEQINESSPNVIYVQNHHYRDKENRREKHKIRFHLRRVSYANLTLLKVERPLRTINISDPYRCLTSSSLDPNDCHLAAGFDNSVIKLWQLNTTNCTGKNLYRSFKDKSCDFEFSNFDAKYDEFESDDDYDSDAENRNVHKYDGKPISYLRDYNTRLRKKKFKQNKNTENSFNVRGGISLRGHNRGVTDVMFSSHFPLLLSTSKDKTMRAWKASNFETVGIYKGHTYPIWCLNESPLGVQVATGSKDLTVRLWSLEFEFPLITYVGHTQDINCISFHSNGAYIATGSSDRSVRLWSVTTGRLLRVYPNCKQGVSTIAFSPNGKLLAAGGEETSVRIFDLAAGKELVELKDHPAGASFITWNKSGTKLAVSCCDASLHIWHVRIITESEMASLKIDPSDQLRCNIFSSWRLPYFKQSTKISFDENDVVTYVGGF